MKTKIKFMMVLLLLAITCSAQAVFIGSQRFYENYDNTGESRGVDLYSDGVTVYVRLRAWNTTGTEYSGVALSSRWQSNSTSNVGMSSISGRGMITVPGVGTVYGFTATTVAHSTCYFEIMANVGLAYGPHPLNDKSNYIKVAFLNDVATAPVVSSPVSVSSLLVSDIKTEKVMVRSSQVAQLHGRLVLLLRELMCRTILQEYRVVV